jgi:hypothetical protein
MTGIFGCVFPTTRNILRMSAFSLVLEQLRIQTLTICYFNTFIWGFLGHPVYRRRAILLIAVQPPNNSQKNVCINSCEQ